jgi:hypothetical protein
MRLLGCVAHAVSSSNGDGLGLTGVSLLQKGGGAYRRRGTMPVVLAIDPFPSCILSFSELMVMFISELDVREGT